MGKMTDALKKARMIKEGKLPSKAPENEPVVDGDETPTQTPAVERTPAPSVPARESVERKAAERKVEAAKAQPTKEAPTAALAPTAAPNRKRPACVTATEPAGASAEEFRALKQRVLRSIRTKRSGSAKSSPSCVILVTGSGTGEGKTTVAANLALALGENASYRVLLVDADMKNPGIPELFGLESGTGLAEILMGRASVEEATAATGLNNLWVMGAGKARQGSEELMTPNKLNAALGSIAGVFRYVVVDGAAPTQMRQTAELAPIADAVLLVVRRSKSLKRDAQEAAKLIRNRDAKILGCVMVD